MLVAPESPDSMCACTTYILSLSIWNFVHTNRYRHIYIHLYVCMYIYTYANTYICRCMSIYVYIYMHVRIIHDT